MAEKPIAWDLRDILTNCNVLYCLSHTHPHPKENWGNLNNEWYHKFFKLFFKCDDIFFNFYIERWNTMLSEL